MKTVSKKEAKARKAAWNKAIDEGRVLRFNGGLSFRSYPTVEERNAAIAELKAQGLEFNIVTR